MYLDFQIHIMSDGPLFVWSSINVIDPDQFFKCPSLDSFYSGIVLVNKFSTSTTVQKSFLDDFYSLLFSVCKSGPGPVFWPKNSGPRPGPVHLCSRTQRDRTGPTKTGLYWSFAVFIGLLRSLLVFCGPGPVLVVTGKTSLRPVFWEDILKF